MKKRALKTLNLNKKSVSRLNKDLLIGGAVGLSSRGIGCVSCKRSCFPCGITLKVEGCD